MRQKIIGAGIAVVLVSLAAVGAFASQDHGVNLLAVTDTPTATDTPAATDTPGGPTNTPTATDTPAAATDTPTATDTPGGPTNTPSPTNTPGGPTDTPAPTDTPSADTATPTPTDTPAADTPTPTAGAGEGDVHGIPDGNPSHHPEDGDGICQHGETVIKTTPSGNKVNVPCETQKHQQNHGHNNN
jgi:hypothetical protein